MDITIEEKKSVNIKKYLLIAILAIAAVIIFRYLWLLGQAEFSVEEKALVMDSVKRGHFVVTVRGSGVLVPETVRWLSANADAKVERVLVKPGDVVQQGDLIVELSNPVLMQQLTEAKWELAAIEEEQKATKITQETTLIEQDSIVLNSKLDYERSVNEHTARKELFETTGAVSRLDYQRTKVEMDQALQRMQFNTERREKIKENLAAQRALQLVRLTQSQKKLEQRKQQVEELRVKATMNSIVLEVPVEAGQGVALGGNIAKLAKHDTLIAELKVPEIQIRDVAVGQLVVIDTRNSKIEGKVIRIDPAVANGNVQVDVAFSEKLPADARPDLSVNGEIKVAELSDALFVSRPLFAQSRSSGTFYKVNTRDKLAERVSVKLGYGSINQIQVLDGLQAGDVIITSDPTRFEAYERFAID